MLFADRYIDNGVTEETAARTSVQEHRENQKKLEADALPFMLLSLLAGWLTKQTRFSCLLAIPHSAFSILSHAYTIYRQLPMGLVLSGQGEKGSPLLTFARRYSQYLSYPLLLVGLLWLLALPLENMARRAYFSENAMMPAQADTGFGSQSDTQAMSQIDRRDAGTHAYRRHSVFDDLGLDTQIHRFEYDEVQGVGNHRGINVHGILRAPRSDGVEALLLAASWRTSDNQTNLNAVRLMAGYGKVCTGAVTDAGEIGIEKWLRAYHGKEPGLLPMSLELPPATKYRGMGLYFEGKTGQLPNLDFINIRFLHGQKTVDDQSCCCWARFRPRPFGSSVGVHAPFLRYRIDALTLSGIVDEHDKIDESAGVPRMPYPWVMHNLGRTLESTLRSLNNLLEHFHQSFFFYILPANRRYISIGDYIPAVGLMVASLLVQAMHPMPAHTYPADQHILWLPCAHRWPTSMATILRVHAVGAVLFLVPLVVPVSMIRHTTSTAYVFTMALASSSMENNTRVDWRQLKALVELYVAVVVGSLSVMNFSLALVVFVTTGLPLLLTRSVGSHSKAVRIATLLVLMAVSPVSVLTLARTHLGAHSVWMSPFRIFLSDFHHYSSLVYPLLCLVYWPVNLLCMVVSMLP
ncbi:Gaa1-domain-containing protein [Linderina pennispora]|uniref:Gaa1-domain-containing protein n=1 Tax=Linderina pennispora TaxID=61395 RepID=A0A1Y1VYP0_9FUNG|nr:Gaa1-domain-containing protein [Linderina pennispora]ORX65944.1 Gaa1-domain-containing protein [Linderina pennispora]